jgi:hypothetical protein
MYLQIMYEIFFVRQQLQIWRQFEILRLIPTYLMYTDSVVKEVIKYMQYVDNLNSLFCLVQHVNCESFN